MVVISMIAGCSKATSTTYCYRCNKIQYGSQAPIVIDTVDACNAGYSPSDLAYQKGDSLIYQVPGNPIDTHRCFRYTK
jgi:hypothetical protein